MIHRNGLIEIRWRNKLKVRGCEAADAQNAERSERIWSREERLEKKSESTEFREVTRIYVSMNFWVVTDDNIGVGIHSPGLYYRGYNISKANKYRKLKPCSRRWKTRSEIRRPVGKIRAMC